MAIGGQEHTIVQYFQTGPGIQSISHNALQVKVAIRAFFKPKNVLSEERSICQN